MGSLRRSTYHAPITTGAPTGARRSLRAGSALSAGTPGDLEGLGAGGAPNHAAAATGSEAVHPCPSRGILKNGP
jgi:hypothetical protein